MCCRKLENIYNILTILYIYSNCAILPTLHRIWNHELNYQTKIGFHSHENWIKCKYIIKALKKHIIKTATHSLRCHIKYLTILRCFNCTLFLDFFYAYRSFMYRLSWLINENYIMLFYIYFSYLFVFNKLCVLCIVTLSMFKCY